MIPKEFFISGISGKLLEQKINDALRPSGFNPSSNQRGNEWSHYVVPSRITINVVELSDGCNIFVIQNLITEKEAEYFDTICAAIEDIVEELNPSLEDEIFQDVTLPTFYEMNQDDNGFFFVDVIENAIDSLETACSFLNRIDNLKWKWVAIALHHALYNYCIANLVNGNPENVISQGRDEDKKRFFRSNEESPWKKSGIVRRSNSGGYNIVWDITEEMPPVLFSSSNSNDQLIGFWSALARVQDAEYWMRRSVLMNALVLSEEEWQSIEWFSDHLRNGLVHFIPKSHAFSIEMTKLHCLNVLRVIDFLALEANGIVHPDIDTFINRSQKTLLVLKEKLQ